MTKCGAAIHANEDAAEDGYENRITQDGCEEE